MKRQLAISINASEVSVKTVTAAPLFGPGAGPVSGRTSPSGATSANAGLVMTFVMGVPIEVTWSISWSWGMLMTGLLTVWDN